MPRQVFGPPAPHRDDRNTCLATNGETRYFYVVAFVEGSREPAGVVGLAGRATSTRPGQDSHDDVSDAVRGLV